MKTRKRKLKFWNAMHPSKEMNRVCVSATSRNRAAELFTNATKRKTNANDIKLMFNNCWPETMSGVNEGLEGVWFVSDDNSKVEKIL